jgi:cell pole-organizing protein PopZ
MKQNGEPSVEEILASIKQVIARDARVGFDAPRRDAPASAPAEAAHMQAVDDVLDLTEPVAPEPAPAPPVEAEPAAPLLAEDTRAAMRDSLAALAAISGPGAVPQIVRSGETSLEGLTRELLRPALTDWLDKNLPALVERLVAAEIARIVGKKV